MTWQIKVTSKRGYEHDDEDAWGLLNEKKAEAVMQGCSVRLARSFGARGTKTVIQFEAPKADGKKPQVTPQQFFPAETEFVTCEFIQVPDLEEEEEKKATEAPVPAPEPPPAPEHTVKNVAG